jgi:hypothetical protein
MAIETPCLIRRAGINGNGRMLLDLKAANGTFDWNWYLGRADMTREMLAIALAAITTEKQVNCVIDDPSTSFSEVLAMLIIK